MGFSVEMTFAVAVIFFSVQLPYFIQANLFCLFLCYILNAFEKNVMAVVCIWQVVDVDYTDMPEYAHVANQIMLAFEKNEDRRVAI